MTPHSSLRRCIRGCVCVCMCAQVREVCLVFRNLPPRHINASSFETFTFLFPECNKTESNKQWRRIVNPLRHVIPVVIDIAGAIIYLVKEKTGETML